jgi:hypothetical protein
MPDALAYFLTWPTYGTWLPGDERGWIQRGRGYQLPDPIRKLEAEARMTDDACVLDEEQRRLVEKTIADHCCIRRSVLHAANCRSNHLHVVVTAGRSPDQVRVQFKAWCTQKLKELERARQSCREENASAFGRRISGVRANWWAERGSRRYIGDDDSLEAVIRYVLEGQ